MHTSRGFTLIELLVVIAIIGILSSVVLASLNTARNKGADAAIKSTIHNARAQAELYYSANGNSYASVCTGTAPGGIPGIANMVNGVANQGVTPTCTSTPNTWMLYAPLKATVGSYWCTDYTGTSTIRTSAPGSSSPC
jgi:type IV pilus assembly protein PilE